MACRHVGASKVPKRCCGCALHMSGGWDAYRAIHKSQECLRNYPEWRGPQRPLLGGDFLQAFRDEVDGRLDLPPEAPRLSVPNDPLLEMGEQLSLRIGVFSSGQLVKYQRQRRLEDRLRPQAASNSRLPAGGEYRGNGAQKFHETL